MHKSFERIGEALVNGASLSDIAEELGLPMPRLVDLLFYLNGRYGMPLYRAYWSASPGARAALDHVNEHLPLVALDPRNLELILLKVDFEGVRKEEVVLASICEHQLAISAYGLISMVESALAGLIRQELTQGFGTNYRMFVYEYGASKGLTERFTIDLTQPQE